MIEPDWVLVGLTDIDGVSVELALFDWLGVSEEVSDAVRDSLGVWDTVGDTVCELDCVDVGEPVLLGEQTNLRPYSNTPPYDVSNENELPLSNDATEATASPNPEVGVELELVLATSYHAASTLVYQASK